MPVPLTPNPRFILTFIDLSSLSKLCNSLLLRMVLNMGQVHQDLNYLFFLLEKAKIEGKKCQSSIFSRLKKEENEIR